jgi:hypothetical protein
MLKDIWGSVHFSCNRKKVFGDSDVLQMTPEQIDSFCRSAGIVWEKVDNNSIHIHNCGLDCCCHGGVGNKNLRPR